VVVVVSKRKRPACVLFASYLRPLCVPSAPCLRLSCVLTGAQRSGASDLRPICVLFVPRQVPLGRDYVGNPEKNRRIGTFKGPLSLTFRPSNGQNQPACVLIASCLRPVNRAREFSERVSATESDEGPGILARKALQRGLQH
jgi:hypothetical protein